MQPDLIKAGSVWSLATGGAQLNVFALQSVLDFQTPHRGLSQLRVFEQPLSGQVLGVAHGPSASDPQIHLPLLDHYVRGSDLVAVYAPADDRPYRLTLNWRVGEKSSNAHVTLDLVISVQTNLLDVVPTLRSVSRLPSKSTKVYPLGDDGRELDVAAARRLDDPQGQGRIVCTMTQLADSHATYCEMIHPSDWRPLKILPQGADVTWSWPLVGHFMEKGVIRRLRIRGVFLSTFPDAQTTNSLFAEFASTPPPLQS